MQKKIVIALCTFVTGTVLSIGQPKLVLNTSSLDFGNVQVGVYDPRIGWVTLLLTNAGTDTLQISSITTSSPTFSIYHTSIIIPPNGSFIDTLRFTPTTVGLVSDLLTILSNDPNSPTTLPLFGFGVGGGIVDAKTQGY